MKLYRVEDSWGVGAYTMRCLDDFVISSRESPRHPMPNRDPMLRDHIEDDFDWFYAFASLEDLRAWFTEDLCEPLRASAAAISVIDAEVYVLGEKQAIFKEVGSKIVERIPL